MRRRSLQPATEEAREGPGSNSSSVLEYQADKVLDDPQQLKKIIYQPGFSYATATHGRMPAESALDFDITGFAQFLARSKCLSVLLFWKEAEEYLNMFSQKDRAECARKIYARYLRKGAEYEVNLAGINEATVEAIEAKLAKPPDDLFAHPQECAYRLMALDLFPRFWDAIKSQEQERASSATRLTEATDLKDVLGDEKEVTLFSEYCRSHFCEEQVLFWLEARDYKLLFDPSDMLSQGEMIFDVYVKASAELRVNISDMAAKAVEEKLNSKVVDQMLFDEVAQEVETFLELDMWPRYKEAVINGAYDPIAGRSDVLQCETDEPAADEGEVDLLKPSKAAVAAALKSPQTCQRFRAAALKQGCAEMVDYCRDCAEYEKLFSDADRYIKAQAMHQRYLSSGCDSPVNIPDSQMKAIHQKINQPTETIFKKSYEECLKVLSDNIYHVYLDMQAAEKNSRAATVAAPVVRRTSRPGGCCTVS